MCVGSWVPTIGGRCWSTFDKKPRHFLLLSRCPVTNVFKLESSTQHFQEPRVCGWQQCSHHVSIQTSKQSLSCLFTTLRVIHKNRQNLHQVLHLFPAFLPMCYWSQVQRSRWVPFMQLLFHLQFPSRSTSVMPFNPSWPRGFQDLHL